MDKGESIPGAVSNNIDTKFNQEPLIEQEPSQAMRLSVVVPMYAEYENGNVFRLIESFTKQSAPPESYEIVCLVNNTPDAVRTRSSGYIENQLTLAIGQYLNGDGALPDGLNDYRKGVLEKAKVKGVVLHMVDFSTTGIERNIGKIRDFGLKEATRRLQTNGQGQEGLVAQLDADTVVETHYVERILQYFSDPKVESLFINLDYFTSEGTENLFRTSFHHQYEAAFDQWINTLEKSQVEVEGPQTIARVKAYQRIGGIVHQKMAEDYRLSESLSKQTEYRLAPNIRVYTSDRAREEGYNASWRLAKMTGEVVSGYKEDVTYDMPRVDFLSRELEALAITNPTVLASEEHVKAIFDRYGIPLDYSKFRERVLDNPWKSRNGLEIPLKRKVALFTKSFIGETGIQTYAKSNEYVDDAVRVFKAILSPDETAKLDELVRQNVLRASVRLGQSRTAIREAVELAYKKGSVTAQDFLQTPKNQEFIERNPWLIDKLNSMRNTYSSPAEAIEKMKKEFPEWMESFECSRLRRSTAILQALTIYLREARNNPHEYPTTNEFLKIIEW